MGKTLTDIAQKLKKHSRKVQLIYAFNGTGKTRLSREFKDLISPRNAAAGQSDPRIKVLYYNAFTEDLFYWDNDLSGDVDRKLRIQPNNFTDWALRIQGQEGNIVTHFQRYTHEKLTPRFNAGYDEISFSFDAGNAGTVERIKISKGEESCLIWCIFYSLLGQVIDILNEPEPADRETNEYNELEYVFIDDPVSSLDDNHLIQLAVDVADLIKSCQHEPLRFIITTHNPLFYNILSNEFNNEEKSSGYKPKGNFVKWRLEKLGDGTYELMNQGNDSPFSYHLYLLTELESAIREGRVEKYHFNFLRQILEKTATFLGYGKWKELLPNEAQASYYNRIINFCSHAKHSGEEVAQLRDHDKRVLEFLVGHIRKNCNFRPEVAASTSENTGIN